MANFYGAIVAFVADAVVTVLVSLVTKPKPVEELAGLVWGVPDPNAPDPASVPKPKWWASPKLLGGVSARHRRRPVHHLRLGKEHAMTETQRHSTTEAPQSAAARLFDIRLLIGGLFVVYGVMLTVAGFFTSDKERAKASRHQHQPVAGHRACSSSGVLFLLWRRLNPLQSASRDRDQSRRDRGRPGHGHRPA